MHIAICDDTEKDLYGLQDLLTQYSRQTHTLIRVSTFSLATDLYTSIQEGTVYDLFILDILMPTMDGITFGKLFRQKDSVTDILYTTTTRDFAIDAFRVKAKDYLLKPVDENVLFPLLDEIRFKLSKKDTLPLYCKDGLRMVSIHDIVFCEARRNYVALNLVNGAELICKDNFTKIKESLSPYPHFLQVHRSYLVNMRYIDVVGTSELILKTSTTILIPKTKSKEIKDYYLDFQMRGDS